MARWKKLASTLTAGVMEAEDVFDQLNSEAVKVEGLWYTLADGLELESTEGSEYSDVCAVFHIAYVMVNGTREHYHVGGVFSASMLRYHGKSRHDEINVVITAVTLRKNDHSDSAQSES